MEWFVPAMCVVCGMLGCTGILSIGLGAIKRSLDRMGQVVEHDGEEAV